MSRIRAATVAAAAALLVARSPELGDRVLAQALPVRITSPHGRIGASGSVRIVAQIAEEHVPPGAVVRFFVDDALVGEDHEGPVYAVEWIDANPFVPTTIRAEARADGGLLGGDTVVLPPLELVDETSVTSVLMDVAVFDEKGRHVRGLTRDRFAVLEDGEPQQIEVVDAATVPTTYTLLVDTSQSMSYRFDFVRRAARRLGSHLKAGDQMVVLPFASALGPMTGPTIDPSAIASALDRMRSEGGTAIADALVAATDRLEGVQGRQIIVLLTDGYDERSQARFDEASESVRRLHGTLYAVGIPGAAGISIRGREALKQLAADTGGAAVFPFRDEDLPGVQDRVAADVAERYLLTYTPGNQERDGQWRRVDVRASEPGYTVKTRSGYFAPAPLPVKPAIEFTVRDLQRRAVTIDVDDLVVLEDGVRQTITSFEEAVSPVSIVMALDESGSMRHDEEAVRTAAGSFIEALRPEDALGVVGFADAAEMRADIATYRTWSRQAVSQYRTSGGTALYDALDLALERLATVHGRRAIVLLTDGRDENNPGTAPGSRRTLNDVITRLRNADAAVFAIGLGPKVDRDTLETLASVSGGEAYFPSDVTLLADDFRRVVEDLRRRYIVSYTSTNPRRDGKWRDVEIKSRAEGLVITSRGRYQAPGK